jgi:hypothetical protein
MILGIEPTSEPDPEAPEKPPTALIYLRWPRGSKRFAVDPQQLAALSRNETRTHRPHGEQPRKQTQTNVTVLADLAEGRRVLNSFCPPSQREAQ